MLNLIGFFEDVADFLPFILMPIIMFAIIIAIVVAVAVKARKNSSSNDYARRNESSSRVYLDGNGRTQQQRDYIQKKRIEQAERKAKNNDASHSHSGVAEKYEPIVGSLGETYDEGCEDLDGVRLVEHDEAYCDDPEHFAETDYDSLQQAIVLGEVLNNPRFNSHYGKRK